MSSKLLRSDDISRHINDICWTLKNVSVDFKEHHTVNIDEAHFSKVHLGFSDETWIKLLKSYILTRTEIQVDFSKCYQYQKYKYKNGCAKAGDSNSITR